jgi:hypothetical protein
MSEFRPGVDFPQTPEQNQERGAFIRFRAAELAAKLTEEELNVGTVAGILGCALVVVTQGSADLQEVLGGKQGVVDAVGQTWDIYESEHTLSGEADAT